MYFRIFFCPKQDQGFKPSASHLYSNIGWVSPQGQGQILILNRLEAKAARQKILHTS